MSEPLYVPAPLGGTNDRMLAALVDSLQDQVVEGFRLYYVKVAPDLYAPDFEDAIRVTVLMDDPAEHVPIWPEDELRVLDEAIRRRSWSLGIGEHLYIRHVPMRTAAQAGIPADAIARARAAREAADR